MMKIIADLHTHTVASDHAFCTQAELISKAIELGYKALAVTDHGPAAPDSPHKGYFTELLKQPDLPVEGLMLLKGVEANAIDPDGRLDLEDDVLARMDWVTCSLHQSTLAPLGYERTTRLWLKVAENPLVDMIGHSEEQVYLYDYDEVTAAFAGHNKVVELNAASRRTRPGNEDNLRRLALACKKNGTKIAVNSDAHSIYRMDELGPLIAMLDEIAFPPELVVNTSLNGLLRELKQHGRQIAGRVEGKLSILE